MKNSLLGEPYGDKENCPRCYEFKYIFKKGTSIRCMWCGYQRHEYHPIHLEELK